MFHLSRLVVTALAAAHLALAASAASAAEPARPVVKTEDGAVVGVVDDGVAVFKGIPYAAPPVGPLRWRPPAPAIRWSAPRDASQFGAVCPQPVSRGFTLKVEPTSEDCLFLNVWAPAKRTAKPLPVMVWIHGGSWTIGSGSKGIYDGASFARDGVVTVTINYRLGALGFFAHPALTHEAGADAPLFAYGHMDDIAALKWVQRNIAAFGGDPSQVTVFGESAGSGSILFLLATPSAKGLFAKAILESAPGLVLPKSLSAAEAQGVKYVARHGLGADSTVEQLRAMPAADLVGDYDATPIPDGRLTPEPVDKAVIAGHLISVPMIIGTNGDEGSLVREYPAIPNQLLMIFSPRKPELKSVYGAEAPDDSSLGRLLFADAVFGVPARWISAKSASPVWLYRFNYVADSERATAPGAYHGGELPFVFDTLKASWIKTPTPADQAVATRLHACWSAFAKSGAPCAGWTAYSRAEDDTLVMDASGTAAMMTGYHRAAFDLIEGALFDRRPAASPSGH